MEVIKKLNDFLQSTDSRDFYKYVIIVIGFIAILIGFLGWRYYSSTRFYLEEIHEINNQREDEIKELFESHERIVIEQKHVDALLEQDPNFKIRGFFDEVLGTLGITQKSDTKSTSSIERENYRESILTVTFSGMNMQELCELLQELEQAKRIFTKELEIQKSEKTPDTINVTLVIATLQPKTSE